MSAYLFIIFVYTLFCLFRFWASQNKKIFTVPNKILFVFMIMGLVARFYFAAQNKYFAFDVNTFKSWAILASDGLSNVYFTEDITVDYPPFLMYILAIIGKFLKISGRGFDGIAFVFSLKLISMFSDVALTLTIYHISKIHLDGREAVALSLAFFLNPRVIYDGAIWGQVDTFLILLLTLTFVFLVESKPALRGVAFAAAFLTKPQSVFIGPALLYYMIKEKDFKKLMRAVARGIFSAVMLRLPFFYRSGPGRFLNLWDMILNRWPFYSMNAFNFYFLAGLNKLRVSLTFRRISFLLLLSFVVLGYFIYAKLSEKYGSGRALFISGGMYFTIMFTFYPYMHERYLLPRTVFSLCCYIYTERSEFFYIFLMGTLHGFLNISAVFPLFYIENFSAWAKILSGYMVAFAVFYIYFVLKISFFEKSSSEISNVEI